MERKGKRLILKLLIGTGMLFFFGGVLYVLYVKIIPKEQVYMQEVMVGEQYDVNEEYLIYCKGIQLMVQDLQGNLISKFTFDRENYPYPDYVAAGEDGYYFLYQSGTISREDGYSMIVQLDYNSRVKKKIFYKDIQYITCQNGVLFLVESKTVDFSQSLLGIHANCYIWEEDFGDDLIRLEPNDEGSCKVGNVVLYERNDNIFCAQPKYDNAMKLNFVKGNNYEESEYQDEEEVFGVCRILRKKDSTGIVNVKDVEKSYFYKKDFLKKDIEVFADMSKVYGILCTEEYCVYYHNGILHKENRKDGTIEKWDINCKEKVNIKIMDGLVCINASDESEKWEMIWTWNKHDFVKRVGYEVY